VGRKYTFFGPGASTVVGGPLYYNSCPTGVPPPWCDHYFRIGGLPSGTHTWQVAIEDQPGGILTPSSGWLKATAVVP